MKLLIAGSRTLQPSFDEITKLLHKYTLPVTEIVSGGAKGVDAQAFAWAKEQGVQQVVFYPGWLQHGRNYAGFVRNNKMAAYADALLAIWDGQSTGTKHMINAMKELGKPVYVESPTAESSHVETP